MRDEECVEFLQRSLPRLGLRWAGYRKVRGTVCKRLRRRLRALRLEGLDDYAALLEERPEEWQRFEAFCRIPISRFYRDRKIFQLLGEILLPDLVKRAAARGDRVVRCWSAGCASGEEAYSLRIVWAEAVQPDFPSMEIAIVATDVEPTMLERAQRACYGKGSLKDVPPQIRDRAFDRAGDSFCLRPEFRQGVVLQRQDIRTEMPDGMFDLILCRNLVFTYFDDHVQREVLERLAALLRVGGLLIIGSHEHLPAGGPASLLPCEALPIFRKRAPPPGPGSG